MQSLSRLPSITAVELQALGIDPDTAAQVESILRSRSTNPIHLALLEVVADHLTGYSA